MKLFTKLSQFNEFYTSVREMERAEVVRKARDAGVHLVSFFWCDNGGIIRGKPTHIFSMEGRLSSKISAAHAMQAMGDMKQLQALVALICPNMNSYRKLSPGSSSAAYTYYGTDNGGAAPRTPSNFRGAKMASTNIEFRPSDSGANPCIALGSLITAGLDGVASRHKTSRLRDILA